MEPLPTLTMTLTEPPTIWETLTEVKVGPKACERSPSPDQLLNALFVILPQCDDWISPAQCSCLSKLLKHLLKYSRSSVQHYQSASREDRCQRHATRSHATLFHCACEKVPSLLLPQLWYSKPALLDAIHHRMMFVCCPVKLPFDFQPCLRTMWCLSSNQSGWTCWR